MTFKGSASATADFGDYNEIAALHGATKTSVDAATAKLEAMRLLLVAIGGYEDGVEGFVDGLEALMGVNNTALGLPADAAGAATMIGQLKAQTAALGLAGDAANASTMIGLLKQAIVLLGDVSTPAPITATQLPSSLGPKTSALSLSFAPATDAGMATETTVAAINTKTPTQGQKVKTGSVPVTLSSDHDPIDTVVKSTATSRSAIIGFVGTAAAATTASTTLTVTATTGVPIVGQTISGTGIAAGTTITAVTGTAPYSLTLSAAATVASGAAVTSVGMQLLMPANTARRGMTIQNQHATAKVWINGVGSAAADASSLLIGPVSFYETSTVHTGTGAISIITDTPGVFIYAREF